MRKCKCGARAMPIVKNKGMRCDACYKAMQRVVAAKQRAKTPPKSKYTDKSIDTLGLLNRAWN